MLAGERRRLARLITFGAASLVAWSLATASAVHAAGASAAADISTAAVARADSARMDTSSAAVARADSARVDTSTAAGPHAPAPRDTMAAAPRDTSAYAGADSSLAGPNKAMWTMDELKRVLGEETGGLAKGVEYKERKSGRVAMVCALLVPGLGQMYNEKPFKAAIAVGLESFYLSQIAMNRRLREREKLVRDAYEPGTRQWNYHDRWVTEYWDRSVDWIWWSGAVVLGIVIDAYVDAKLDDMRFKVEARAADGDVGLSFLVRY
jgi:hypothetical protein